jgi:choline dehydrogenase-like flavoprotein
VGQYLQDKYGALIGPFLVSEGKGLVYDRDYTLIDFLQWIKFGTGKLKSSLSEGTWAIYSDPARARTTKRQIETNERSSTPDIHSYILSLSITKEVAEGASKSFNFNPEVRKFFSSADKADSFYQLVTINRQNGHGYVKLTSSDPYAELEIDPKYLEDESDFETLVEGKI